MPLNTIKPNQTKLKPSTLPLLVQYPPYFHFLLSNFPFLNFLMLIFTSLFLAILGLHCSADFSLVMSSRGYSPAVVLGLLIGAASLTMERRL